MIESCAGSSLPLARSFGEAVAMTLRDRLRRWWSPAQWEDDHPTERKQREQRKKGALGSWFGQTGKFFYGDGPGLPLDMNHERDFKKPR